VFRLQATPDDRSTFLELSNCVQAFMEKKEFQGRNLTIVGESCGGLIAAHVGLRSSVHSVLKSNQSCNVDRIVLVNPATSFDRTSWSLGGRAIASTPGNLFPVLGVVTLLATVVQPKQISRVGDSIRSRVNSVNSLVDELNGLLAAGNEITKVLPAETLEWRLSKWLDTGSRLVSPRLKDLKIPTLVLVGKEDRLLPSLEEGRRLRRLLPCVQVKEVSDGGHALLDGTIDLGKELRLARVFKPKYTGRRDEQSSASLRDTSYLEFPLPTDEEMEEFDKQLGYALQTAFSPVFFSIDNAGRVVRGLGGVPSGIEGRPVLLVGNHQLFGADLALLIRQFVKEKKTLPRGLAHPMVFQGMEAEAQVSGEDTRVGQQQGDLFLNFGAVQVSPLALYDLLSRNETVLLFPGGVNEAFHGKGDAYKLRWPKQDFVRMAALHKALIVPFGAVGMADSAEMLLDGDEIIKLPFGLGAKAQEQSRRMPQARAGGAESMIAPLIIPSIPRRNYFLFQQPIDTAKLCPDVSDKEACRRVFTQAKQSVEKSIEYLLEYRKSDPFDNTAMRLFYETVTGKQAPSAISNMADQLDFQAGRVIGP
jgi:pimeloyl-ACP methyl ester carboxylesterase/1-acyl-sn-glycerol-3-phosphate acyltransferase